MANRLTDKLSWKELVEQTIDKIKRYHPKDFNENDFREWMMKREGRGYLFDYLLIWKCYKISKNLEQDYDHFMVICGGEGEGKSTLAAQICSWVDLTFKPQHMCFNIMEFLQEIEKRKPTQALQIDEAGLDLFSREAMSSMNRILIKTFMIMRQKRLLICLCIPNFHILDSYVKDHRVNTLLQIKQRGYYMGFVGAAIQTISKDGTRYKQVLGIKVPEGTFWGGYFNKIFPLNIPREEYIAKKDKHIKEFLEKINKSNEAQQISNDPQLIPLTKVARRLGLNPETLRIKAQKGEIKCKRIGKRYLIPIKELKRLEDGINN